jgi:hypothetical protein
MKFSIVGALAVVGAMMVGSAAAEDAKVLPLAEARAQIGDAVENPDSLTDLMKSVAADDQATLLGDVNAAIANVPGSDEVRAATYVKANRAALKGAAKGNLLPLLAETFATVKIEDLTLLNERYAADVFNRAADSKRTYTDEQFTAIASNAMVTIRKRLVGSDAAAVRDAFAVLMFVRASNGTPADLRDVLVAGMADEEAQKLAKEEWFPAALAEGEAKSYEPMLGYADAGKMPDPVVAMRVLNTQRYEAMISDLAAAMVGRDGKPVSDLWVGKEFTGDRDTYTQDIGLDRVPRTLRRDLPWNPDYRRKDMHGDGTIYPDPRDESHGYQFQRP